MFVIVYIWFDMVWYCFVLIGGLFCYVQVFIGLFLWYISFVLFFCGWKENYCLWMDLFNWFFCVFSDVGYL